MRISVSGLYSYRHSLTEYIKVSFAKVFADGTFFVSTKYFRTIRQQNISAVFFVMRADILSASYIKKQGGQPPKMKGEMFMQKCMDDYHTNFETYEDMFSYHKDQSAHSRWDRRKVKDLTVAPLDSASTLVTRISDFGAGVSKEAVEDTVQNLGLAIKVDKKYYPVRDTAYKSLLDRAKIGGTALPKLERKELAKVLNACLKLYSADALLLFRDEKVTAVHSGDQTDYSVLPVEELLETLQEKLDERFPENEFETGYCDHSMVSASWRMPKQKEELLEAYTELLEKSGKKALAGKLMPGVRFMTSDTGTSSAKVSALLVGGQHPIHIGSCISVEHRHQKKIGDFEKALDGLFAKFGDSVAKLQKLLTVDLDYPVNTMTRLCKKLSMPKKAAVEAIKMFEMANGNNPATAHDVFMAMQEIPYILRTQKTSQSKLLSVEENLARALSVRWSEYDLAKGVDY